jgi:hypothetical protein
MSRMSPFSPSLAHKGLTQLSYFDLDTDDYNNVTPDLIQNAKDNFANAVNPSDPSADAWLSIAHDIHEQTALNLTQYMLETLQEKGYRAVTVGECLGDPKANWYRSSSPGQVKRSLQTPRRNPAERKEKVVLSVFTAPDLHHPPANELDGDEFNFRSSDGLRHNSRHVVSRNLARVHYD